MESARRTDKVQAAPDVDVVDVDAAEEPEDELEEDPDEPESLLDPPSEDDDPPELPEGLLLVEL